MLLTSLFEQVISQMSGDELTINTYVINLLIQLLKLYNI